MFITVKVESQRFIYAKKQKKTASVSGFVASWSGQDNSSTGRYEKFMFSHVQVNKPASSLQQNRL